jgi:hypothetical protein
MRIQHDTTLSMNLQVEIELPRQIRDGGAGSEPTVVVMPAGGDGDPSSLSHRWTFRPDEADQLGRLLQEAAERARDMA